MVDLIKTSFHITEKIKELEEGRQSLQEAAFKKAQSAADYEKRLAVTILKLRNGVKMALEDTEIENPPVTILERVARGICWEALLEKDKNEAFYKNIIQNLECIKAELNGFQSINRFLSETEQ